ncbi:MAG TPA: hypothetical protein VJ840_18645 [Gemmatimonadaceae bacterium]|nr:hypothetical protein [Gemmatimonadaceae bacterium]
MSQLDISPVCVVGAIVVRREHWKLPLADTPALAEFSSFPNAVLAVKLLRRSDWLAAAELTLDDEDFLTLQVLVRRLNKKRPKAEFRNPNQLSPDVQTDNTRVSLEDLL